MSKKTLMITDKVKEKLDNCMSEILIEKVKGGTRKLSNTEKIDRLVDTWNEVARKYDNADA